MTRNFTGWHMTGILVAFFGVVIAVNVVMARFAVTTFGGVDTENAYKAGLAFRKEINAAEEQSERHWVVDVNVETLGAGARAVTVRALDATGKPLSALAGSARLSHPTDARQDVTTALAPLGDGRYRAVVEAHKGQWDLVVDFAQGDERVFRSKNRVQLP